MLRRLSPEFIGIDIGHYAVKVARVKKISQSFIFSFLSYDVIPADIRDSYDKEALDRWIFSLFKQYKITKGTPVVHVQVGDVVMREVRAEGDLSEDELEGAIEFDLSPALPFSIDQMYFDFSPIAEERGKYLAVAVRRDAVDAKIELFKSISKSFANPQVDVDIFAYERLINAFLCQNKADNECVAFVDIGYERCRFHIYCAGRFVFTREQLIGGNQVNEIIHDVYDISLEEAELRKIKRDFGVEYEQLVLDPYVQALAEQINFALELYNMTPNAEPLKSIYLIGGGAQLNGLMRKLQELLSVPVQKISLSKHIRAQRAAPLQSGLHHVLAVGLSMEAD